MKTFADFKIDVGSSLGPEVFTTCPQCSPSRKKKNAKCLSVNIEKGVWWCAHCDYRGTLKGGEESPGRKIYRRPSWPEKPVIDDPLLSWFASRGISRELVQTEGIAVVEAYLAQLEERVPCIAFPYTKGGELVNVKYRGLTTKAFQQVGGAEKVLYRQDSIKPDCVVITEGEIDALSCVHAGFLSSVSVPDGAPAPTAKNYSAKFTYLDQDPDPFAGVQDIILAVDTDEPGQVLQRELARRLGFERCRSVVWPPECKDANETLLKYGVDQLQRCLENAQPFPVQDVVSVADLAEDVARVWGSAPSRGLSTGWGSVDQFYTIEPGQLTVITGIPSSGKSEWLDALMLNLATLHGWRFAVCSPENMPLTTHCAKLLEKHIGKPFWVGPTARMTGWDLTMGLQWLNDHVTMIASEDNLTVVNVLEKAAVLVRRQGIRGLLLDPFNEFDHTRERGMTETEYISNTLGAMKRWARKHQVHVWLVAHPQKLYRREDGSYPIPTPYDISGSAAFRNKADNCITVWRDMENTEIPVQIHIQKVRFKHIGTVGMAELHWDRRTGRYANVHLGEVRRDYQAD
jgi:twinkle protein